MIECDHMIGWSEVDDDTGPILLVHESDCVYPAHRFMYCPICGGLLVDAIKKAES